MPNKLELHFYPGIKQLILLTDGNQTGVFEAWGGPANKFCEQNQPMCQTPTEAGRFVIYDQKPYKTNTWPRSQIAWGTPLKDTGSDVLYDTGQQGTNQWKSISKKYGGDTTAIRDYLKDQNRILFGRNEVPRAWVLNDFGPIAIRYFKDKNHDGKLNGTERTEGSMFHTTPENEGEYAQGKKMNMTESHGCIHIRPPDRDVLIKLGAFDMGTPLVIHKYSERPKH